uniref:Uncharacterized protein n=1 Tax=Arundo donax TaxID=35708 RepID=A0A0A9GCJ8_ARUDO
MQNFSFLMYFPICSATTSMTTRRLSTNSTCEKQMFCIFIFTTKQPISFSHCHLTMHYLQRFNATRQCTIFSTSALHK